MMECRTCDPHAPPGVFLFFPERCSMHNNAAPLFPGGDSLQQSAADFVARLGAGNRPKATAEAAASRAAARDRAMQGAALQGPAPLAGRQVNEASRQKGR